MHDVQSAPNNVQAIRLRRMTQAGQVAHVGTIKMHIRFRPRNLKNTDHMEWMLKEDRRRVWTGL